MNQIQPLIALLSDGEFHSGEDLAVRLSLSRTSIWNMINQLQDYGLEIDSVRGRGYRIANPPEMLCTNKILSRFLSHLIPPQIEYHFSIPSTNSYLMETLNRPPESGRACFTEHQTNGRGRRGKVWQSSFASNLTFSFAREFQTGPQSLAGLSLVVALAVIQALAEYGLKELSVKWPNDILVQGKKIAGILIELAGESQGPTKVVIGIGINGLLKTEHGRNIDQPWTDIVTQTGRPFKRNLCSSLVLSSLVQHLAGFEKKGLKGFLTTWHQYDAALNQRLQILTPSGSIEGIGKGVDEQGHLLLEREKQITRHTAGEVSLRNPYATR